MGPRVLINGNWYKPRDTARSNQCQQPPQGASGAVREPVLLRSVLHDRETDVALTMPLIPTPFHTAWANRRHRGSERAVVANPALDHSRDYVCLNLCSNLTTSVNVRDLGRGVVGCGLKPACISGFNLVA